jgi:hypothetical protein
VQITKYPRGRAGRFDSAPRLPCCIPWSCAFPKAPLYSGFRVFRVCLAPPPPRLPPPPPPQPRIPLKKKRLSLLRRERDPHPPGLSKFIEGMRELVDLGSRLGIRIDIALVYGLTTGETSRRSDASSCCLPLSSAASVRRSLSRSGSGCLMARKL